MGGRRGTLQPFAEIGVTPAALPKSFPGVRESDVRIANRKTLYHSGGMMIAVTLCVAATPAAAGNFFENLFGGVFQRPSPPQQSSQPSAYAEPSYGGERHSGGEELSYGSGTAFCVRTCDGRYFPMQRHANSSPAEICHAFCPASRTMVFSGGKIDVAVAPNGTRYTDLDTAFTYRDKLVSNCTCTGGVGGLAHLNTTSDPTLRPGDIVATDQGFATFTGKAAEFTPVNPSSALTRQLVETKVRPAPPEPEIPVANNDVPLRKGRAQAAR